MDLSLLRSRGDEAIAVALTCLGSWSSLITDLQDDGEIRIVVRDEVWRQMRLGLRAVQAVDADLRLSRADKQIQLLVMHKPSDLLSVGAAGSQEATIAADLLALCSTRILLGQSTRVADALAADLALTEQEQHALTGWAMQRRGRALWKIETLPGVKVQTVLSTAEAAIFDTNAQLRPRAAPTPRRRARQVTAPSSAVTPRRAGDEEPAVTSRLALVAAVLVVVVVLPGVTLGLAVVAALGGAVAGGGCGGDGGIGGGSQQIGGRLWSAEQTTNAHTIIAGAAGRGLPKRAAVIAVVTAIVESGLHNHPGNHDGPYRGADREDRAGLGVFAQRPSPRWGTPAQILNPAAATDSFYTALVALPGWDTLPPGAAAAAIQSDRARDAGSAGPSGTPRRRPRRPRWSTGSGPDPTCPPRRPRRVLPAACRTASAPGVLVPPACPDPGGSDIGESDIATPGRWTGPGCRPTWRCPPTRPGGRRWCSRWRRSGGRTCSGRKAPAPSTAPG